ncbi:hypothetical protein Salat_1197800 [Sesamum alatum]|uniref:Myb/SANT-like domain-containing protein n=1 Tax=Sesamum alatum TaxID=300844 RepID=A0AAE1YF83_9LAMI|nr:hypothetical protein Salat_1197800 [Sesamum alatum]
MNRSTNNQSQSRSTGNSYTNTIDSDGSDVVRTCLCGLEIVVRTSWTNSNPGHRFRGCSGDGVKGRYTGLIESIEQSRQTIEGVSTEATCIGGPRWRYDVVSFFLDCGLRYNTGMAGDGVFWQQKFFYCEHWTPKTEDIIVQLVLAHHRKGTFHHEYVNCLAVLCALFDIILDLAKTLSYSYYQHRLAKLKIRYQVFSWITGLVAVKWDPKTNIISMDKYVWEQIAKSPSGNDFEDESVFFDHAGTCLDDEWVHDKLTSSDESSQDNSYGIIDNSNDDDLSCWAFVKEYYASDSKTASVNKHPNMIRRTATSGYCTPLE